ncbi:hypothetical protein K439DRAFT_1408508 [Ramaria rubella]|nr:hypothetical protein K439DRAFT_1408508 [Ramaria rubella]
MTSSSPAPVDSLAQTSSLSTQDEKETTKKEGIEDILSRPFDPLNVGSITSAYDTESAKLPEFEAGMSKMLLSAMLEVRAWATARPIAEQDATGDALTIRLKEVQKTHDEQGRFCFFEQTRLRLLNFISSIKSALAALTTGL